MSSRYEAGLALRRTKQNRILSFRDGRQIGASRKGEDVERIIGRKLTPAEERRWIERGIWTRR